MKSKILKISLVCIMIVSILIMLTGCASNTKNENNIIEENKVESEVKNTEEDSKKSKNNNIAAQNTSNKESEIAEELFLEYLKNAKENSGKKLKEYKIEKINVLSGSKRNDVKEIFESAEGIKINEKDIFAEVIYSVKPDDIENTDWIAGNGEKRGDWLVEKSACVFIKYDNGTYKIQENSTGW